MRLMLKKNGGLADARNFGIRFARAEWIFPLDSDDIIAPDFLAKVKRCALSVRHCAPRCVC